MRGYLPLVLAISLRAVVASADLIEFESMEEYTNSINVLPAFQKLFKWEPNVGIGQSGALSITDFDPGSGYAVAKTPYRFGGSTPLLTSVMFQLGHNPLPGTISGDRMSLGITSSATAPFLWWTDWLKVTLEPVPGPNFRSDKWQLNIYGNDTHYDSLYIFGFSLEPLTLAEGHWYRLSARWEYDPFAFSDFTVTTSVQDFGISGLVAGEIVPWSTVTRSTDNRELGSLATLGVYAGFEATPRTDGRGYANAFDRFEIVPEPAAAVTLAASPLLIAFRRRRSHSTSTGTCH